MEQDAETQELIEEYQDRVLADLTESLQGAIISETLDQLSKELVRLKQERRIAAMVKIAERERRRREAEESGRRQAEEVIRRREDVLFKDIIGTHEGTVDSWLQTLVTDSVRQKAKEQACTEITLRAN